MNVHQSLSFTSYTLTTLILCVRRRSKKKYEKDGSIELSATDSAGEVIKSVSDDDSDGEYDDDEEDEDDEDDKDKGVPKPVP